MSQVRAFKIVESEAATFLASVETMRSEKEAIDTKQKFKATEEQKV